MEHTSDDLFDNFLELFREVVNCGKCVCTLEPIMVLFSNQFSLLLVH